MFNNKIHQNSNCNPFLKRQTLYSIQSIFHKSFVIVVIIFFSCLVFKPLATTTSAAAMNFHQFQFGNEVILRKTSRYIPNKDTIHDLVSQSTTVVHGQVEWIFDCYADPMPILPMAETQCQNALVRVLRTYKKRSMSDDNRDHDEGNDNQDQDNNLILNEIVIEGLRGSPQGLTDSVSSTLLNVGDSKIFFLMDTGNRDGEGRLHYRLTSNHLNGIYYSNEMDSEIRKQLL